MSAVQCDKSAFWYLHEVFLDICLNLLQYIAIKTLLKNVKMFFVFEPGRSNISRFLFPDFYYHF